MLVDDAYRVLGVERGAPLEEIQAAYRRKLIETHPDTASVMGAPEAFHRVQEAYKLVKNQPKPSPIRSPSSGSNAICPGEIILDVTVGDLFSTRALSLATHPFRCAACEVGSLGVECPSCAGRGRTQRFSGGISTLAICFSCRGTGKIKYPAPGQCSLSSSGLRFRLPAGARDGDRVVAALPEGSLERGNVTLSGTIGIRLRLVDDPVFTPRGDDLLCRKLVDFASLVLGDELLVSGAEGAEHKVRLTPGTQPGTIITIEDAGLPKATGTRGRLLVRLELTVPTSPSPAQKLAAEAWLHATKSRK